MVLCMMSEMVRLGKVIEGLWRVRSAVGRVVEEGGKLSGGYGVQETDASAVKENNTGKALGTSASPAKAPSVQAEICEGSGGSAAGAVGGTPDQPRLLTALDVHVRGGLWVPPTLAAICRVEEAAVVKAVGSALGHANSASTVSTVLWESQANVDDRAGFDGGGKAEAAGGAAATVGSMQVVEEEIEAADLREATCCGALPTDGGVRQQLEQGLGCARSEQAEQVLPGERCSWEETEGEG